MIASEKQGSMGSPSTKDGGGLYVHVPYCRRKCVYCDFFSGGARIADFRRLREALASELRERIGELPVPLRTLYIGGGTPSLIPEGEFLDLVNDVIVISRNAGALPAGGLPEEFTIEVNPEDVSEEKIEAWLRGGVNRVSMGVQSLDDGELRFLQRGHDAAQAVEAARKLRENFGNVSLDIIFGVPGQTLDSLRGTLRRLLELNPDHLSAYSLMYEEGTALTAMMKRGDFQPVDEEESITMYYTISDILSEAGYNQYEISNYAKHGKRSRHNSSYWSFRPYLGIGPSAHSYDGAATRRSNPSTITRYLDFYAGTEKSKGTFYEEETLSEEERLEEWVMLRMRTVEGLSLETTAAKFGMETARNIRRRALELQADVTVGGEYVALTRAGLMRSDAAILHLLNF